MVCGSRTSNRKSRMIDPAGLSPTIIRPDATNAPMMSSMITAESFCSIPESADIAPGIPLDDISSASLFRSTSFRISEMALTTPSLILLSYLFVNLSISRIRTSLWDLYVVVIPLSITYSLSHVFLPLFCYSVVDWSSLMNAYNCTIVEWTLVCIAGILVGKIRLLNTSVNTSPYGVGIVGS